MSDSLAPYAPHSLSPSVGESYHRFGLSSLVPRILFIGDHCPAATFMVAELLPGGSAGP